ncbi:YebG family protein [Marinomonas sp. PE14-40]|uniref:YebG family protein n=1 Tax=Marinomonas sp. PE14-40 TaxID=3060621 RepID=UPI003F661CBC
MPVIIKYVVERDGIEKMTFASKAEADAYDKLLDTADDISQLLSDSRLIEEDSQLDALSMYLAQNKELLLQALGSKRKVKASPKTNHANENQTPLDTSASHQDLEDLVIEKDDDQVDELVLDMDQDDSIEDLIDAA